MSNVLEKIINQKKIDLLVVKKKYNINYIHSAKRLGVHKALLLTLKKSKGEFIFFRFYIFRCY